MESVCNNMKRSVVCKGGLISVAVTVKDAEERGDPSHLAARRQSQRLAEFWSNQCRKDLRLSLR